MVEASYRSLGLIIRIELMKGWDLNNWMGEIFRSSSPTKHLSQAPTCTHGRQALRIRDLFRAGTRSVSYYTLAQSNGARSPAQPTTPLLFPKESVHISFGPPKSYPRRTQSLPIYLCQMRKLLLHNGVIAAWGIIIGQDATDGGFTTDEFEW